MSETRDSKWKIKIILHGYVTLINFNEAFDKTLSTSIKLVIFKKPQELFKEIKNHRTNRHENGVK